MSSDFFVTKPRFFIFLSFFPLRPRKNKVLCTNSKINFFPYAQYKRKFAQGVSSLFGQDDDFLS